MFLLFLDDPLAPSLSLKPSAERLLGLPPSEQDAVRDWLISHGVVRESATKGWGAFICEAPGDLVGLYAAGDTDRTKQLYDLLYPKIVAAGMEEAYEREIALMPILCRAELQGMRIDLERLKADIVIYTEAYKTATHAVKAMVYQDQNHEFNVDSGSQLAQALLAAELTVPEDEWPLTATGKLSTARETLHAVITDPDMYAILSYRSALKTLLGTFMTSWVANAEANNGRLHPSWNQVRDATNGTRTGRLSCSTPNLQNVPNEFKTEAPEGYPPLPHMRKYILPEEGELLVSADFHSQEIRVLGHFAEGAIMKIYSDNPQADVHAVAADLINDITGLNLTRKHTKIVAFSILYGAGVGKMSDSMGVSMGEARNIKNTYLKILTGVPEFMRRTELAASRNDPVRSWGGRLLHRPDPVVEKDGHIWNKDYVLLNYLIQGSSADLTKASIIAYDKARKHGTFLATVHDEIVISVSAEHMADEVKRLRYAMDTHDNLAVNMRATVKIGPDWATMEDYE
jgi:DNA polymerase-1